MQEAKETITASNFYCHKFADIGEARMAVVGDRALISVTGATNLVKKDRKHLIKWLLNNKIVTFHCSEIGGTGFLTAMFFDDFIDFCMHEKDVADNQNAVIFLAHLLAQEDVA